MQKPWVTSFLLCLLVALASPCSRSTVNRGQPVTFATPYQAVLLSNGSVYYGKLSGYGTPTPVLSDVLYIVSKSDSQTKQVAGVASCSILVAP